MKGIFWLLALFALAATLALGAHLNVGYVLLVYPPWRVELSLNFLLLLVLAGFGILYLLVRAVVAMLGMPGRVAVYRQNLAREKSFQLFQDAFRLLFEGRFGQAFRKAAEAHAGGAAPGLAALIAARAAQRLRRTDEQDYWLAEATRIDPQIRAARWMLEAEMHVDNRRFDEALAALAHLQKTSGRHIAALRIELRARQGAGHWDEVLRIARQLEKRRALPPELAAEIKYKAHREAMFRRQSDAKALLDYLRALPAAEISPRIAQAAAQSLLNIGAMDEAARVIETQLEKSWESQLIELYGHCADGRTTERIAMAEKWLLQHADDADLLLALGRLCRAQRLWGKSQSYLEASLALANSRDGQLELARLFDELGRAEEANRCFRRAVSAA
jgi:HemY protein